eukprot:CAMPEP_0183828660 /NCGR_PEP_ID=MMETSP0807_2-20130328/2906_1 /TAXON_ID=88271 /ORGANISM="Picocystis salinarum, Strain CCMP1897" /LENGTH=1161 /DNA_ID=CAMNT_0026073861 /DNA_START=30 /DNA_END=3515 /DNA_ORIENTATION=+
MAMLAPLALYKRLHEAVRAELEDVTACVVRLGEPADGLERVPDLCQRLAFLRALYRFHSEAEEAVIFPALDAKVRNVSKSYLMDHGAETALFDALLARLRGLRKLEPKDVQRLAGAAEGLQATVRAHLVKEEQQVFPLLLKHFDDREQAEIVARFLCSIPLATVEKVLSWVATRAPREEQRGASFGVQRAVQDPLLRELLGRWLEPMATQLEDAVDVAQERCQADLASTSEPLGNGGSGNGVPINGFKNRANSNKRPPIRHIILMHDAIRAEFENFHKEVRNIAQAYTSDRSLLVESVKKLTKSFRFLQSVCMFHSSAEDEVVFPAADAASIKINDAILSEHSAEDKLFHVMGTLLHQMKELLLTTEEISSFGRLCEKLLKSIDKVKKLVNYHMEKEEKEVLPEIEHKLPYHDQCVLVWKTLLAMPLQLLERILPWVAAELTEEEMGEMLRNMRIAAPSNTEPALLELLSAWLQRGRKSHATGSKKRSGEDLAVEEVMGCASVDKSGTFLNAGLRNHTVKRLHVHESSPSLFQNASCAFGEDSKFVEAEGYNREVEMLADEHPAAQPIDHIFKFHKALKIELEMLESIAGNVVVNGKINEETLKDLHGRFYFLTGLYDAHSEAEDEIVFPALESKEALHNVSHSYSLDHKQEAMLLKECKTVLEGLCDKGLENEIRLGKAATLQRMCTGIRHALTVHVVKEEQELWPLFAEHFSTKEQDALVGQIIGRTGAEVLQVMLPWVTSALTQQEQESMHDSFRNAARNTMFDQWLATWWKNKDNSPKSQTHTESSSGDADPQTGRKQADASAGLQAVASYLQGSHADSKGILPSIQQECKAEAIHFKPGWESLFRMNQKQLEEAVRKVSSDASLDPQRKAYLMQNLMASRWIAAQQQTISAKEGKGTVDPAQPVTKSFFDVKKGIMGCKHYQRRCKLVAACCGAVVACRFCHDEVSDHNMNRHETQEMMCMVCGTRQKVDKSCANCKTEMARYFCKFCKLFDDDPKHEIYHCPFCNLCRRGKGLGIDVFHCMTCNACMSLSMKKHVCREHGLESECPICSDYLFTSSMPVKELPCGHFMHSKCFKTYSRSSYTCPICSKSMGDMSVYFKMLDAILAAERHYIPLQYKDKKQSILCNDCGTRGEVPFHFVYHKCVNSTCGSYNTRMA